MQDRSCNVAFLIILCADLYFLLDEGMLIFVHVLESCVSMMMMMQIGLMIRLQDWVDRHSTEMQWPY